MNKIALVSGFTGLGILLGVWLTPATAQTLTQTSAATSHSAPHASDAGGEFQRIEQPLWLKGLVILGGLGLIGLELWWFLGSTPPSPTAIPQGEGQEMPVKQD